MPNAVESPAPIRSGEAPALLRTMGLFSLVVYGVGDMIGSGIYGTVGKAAGHLGNAVWIAFLIAMVAAILNGLSYACLASRYPRAAGAAYVTHRAFHFPFLSYLIGLTVTASGLTSMATSTNVFANTLAALSGGPWLFLALLFLGGISFVNFWGIRQSMWTNIACTAVEVGGLVFIILVGARYWGDIDYFETPRATFDAQGRILDHGLALSTLLAGSVLTFFSFIGFEDMLNVAEEVKQPERTMPWGIVLALGVATLLYLGVSITAVSVVNYRDLAAVPAPLSMIAGRAAPWLHPRTFDYITLFAVANTVLINYIMGSRLLYGMARQGLLPSALGRIHPDRRTPHIAILTLLGAVLVLTLSGGVAELAAATGLLLLFSFLIVNTALIVLKLRPAEPAGAFEVPMIVPALALVVNATLIFARLTEREIGLRAPIIAGLIVLVVTILYLLMRPKIVSEATLAAAEAGAVDARR
jgi:amino acid transporter